MTMMNLNSPSGKSLHPGNGGHTFQLTSAQVDICMAGETRLNSRENNRG